MSLSIVEPVLKDFITNNEHNDLIVLSGDWGVGKTYFWNNIITSHIEKDKTVKYSYVSLFGINSIETLKNVIIANQVLLKDNIGNKIKKAFTFIRTNALKSPVIRNYTGNLIDEIIFSSLNKIIICFDDIERIGKELSIKDFIGIVTQLKESKDCKIIIILNEESMEKEEFDEFKKHIEKVIDIRLKFDRTYKEALKCIIPENNRHFDLILENCVKLQLKNLRIFQRIKRYIEYLKLESLDIDDNLVKDIIHSLVLFSYCYFNKETKVDPPTFYYLKNYILEYQLLHDELGKEQYEKWYQFLSNYGYTYTSDIDLSLIDYIEKGYLNKDNFNQILKQKNNEIIENQKYQRYHDVWYRFRNTFNQTEEEFIDELMKAYKDAFNLIDIKNLNSIILILKALGQKDKVDQIINEYFNDKTDYLNSLNLKYHSEPLEFDPDLRSKYYDMIKKSDDLKSLGEILNKVLSEGWSEKDEEMLKCYEGEDYYNLFLSDNENIGFYVSKLVNWSKSSSDSFLVDAGKKAIQALKKISSESEFNKLKLAKAYELKFEDLK
ncbi:hypothetical protein D4R71_02275 [bacterium]|nr:MAG: hypothetical protein D4R71_02275 [bacterium]